MSLQCFCGTRSLLQTAPLSQCSAAAGRLAQIESCIPECYQFAATRAGHLPLSVQSTPRFPFPPQRCSQRSAPTSRRNASSQFRSSRHSFTGPRSLRTPSPSTSAGFPSCDCSSVITIKHSRSRHSRFNRRLSSARLRYVPECSCEPTIASRSEPAPRRQLHASVREGREAELHGLLAKCNGESHGCIHARGLALLRELPGSTVCACKP